MTEIVRSEMARSVSITKFLPYPRECGVVSSTRQNGYGFIQCAQRKTDAFFRFSEFIGEEQDLREGMAVEFELCVTSDGGRGDGVRAERIVVSCISQRSSDS